MSLVRQWIDRRPGSAVQLARAIRTALLWVLEPIDWIHRRITFAAERGPVPPLWIRRHSGPIWAFERAAGELAATIAVLDLLRADDHVLDLGCGCGSMALEFQRMLGPRGTYLGFDVHADSIRWCRTSLGRDARLRFELAPLASPWSKGKVPVTSYRFPMEDATADFVLAKSVFTHLMALEADHYLGEIRRVLRPGRHALVTAFLLEGGGAVTASDGQPSIRFLHGGDGVWWELESRPHSTVGYERRRLLEMVERRQLHVRQIIPGHWSGHGVSPSFQDILILS